MKIKDKTKKKFYKKKSFLFGILILFLVLVSAAAYYNVANGSSVWINEHNKCYQVSPSGCGGSGVFVPTNTSAEWSDFIAHKPSCVTTVSGDKDGDGYFISSCTSTNVDCYDQNSNAHPGQTAWFTTDRGDGSYDYDCNGQQTKRYTVAGFCTKCFGIGSCTVSTGQTGWTSSTPSCGSSGGYITNPGGDCYLDSSSHCKQGTACTFENRIQPCH